MASGQGRTSVSGGTSGGSEGVGEEKPKKRRRYSGAQDVALLQTIASVQAHLAPYGEKMKRFADTADQLNESQLFPWQVDAKNCLERFNLLVGLHVKNERKTKAARPTEHQLRDSLLDQIVDQLTDMRASKETEKGGQRRKEEPVPAVPADPSRRRQERAAPPQESPSPSSHATSGSNNRKRPKLPEHEDFIRQVFDKIVDVEFSKHPGVSDAFVDMAASLKKQEEILSQQTTIMNQQTTAITQLAEILSSLREEARESRELLRRVLK